MLFRHIIRIVLGLAFCFSSVLKLFSVDEFELYIYSFSLFNFDFSALAARCLIAFEFVIGFCITFQIYYRPAIFASASLLVLFSVFLIWRIAVGDHRNCHCFGELIELDPVESLLKNAISIIAVALSWNCNAINRFSNLKPIWLFLTYLLVFAIVTIVSPPDFFLRIGREPDDIESEYFEETIQKYGLEHDRHVICFFSTGCEFCQKSMIRLSKIIPDESQNDSLMFCFFMQTDGIEVKVRNFYEAYASGRVIPYSVISPLDFLPITNGSMPVVVVCDKGEIVKEYDYITLDEHEIVSYMAGL